MSFLNRSLIFAISILLAIAVSACKKGPDDAAITKEVKDKLAADATTKPVSTSINVESKEGVVTLSGDVDSDAQKSTAAQVAKSVEGVKSVNDNLKVKPMPVAQQPYTNAPDAELKQAVEANLNKYGVTGVSVDVADGVVTLKGNIQKVKAQDAMKAAMEAKPKKVENQLNYKEK
ncbi:MAG TPA: BON domain-containing protein [Blastocatellia bacterium]|nr:BON domain-containing protein [Blastocatellia bacterium]